MVGRRILSDGQLERYSRHVRLDEVGLTGQRKLIDSKVIIIGAGGLGSPAAVYLAAAGVGTIGLVDYDRVDLSNLQRQVLHFTDDVGRLKTESARDHLNAMNPEVTVIEHRRPLTSDNAFDVLGPYDVIINGSDNFPTRYLVNDAAYLLRKPLVDASILRFEGQATVFVPGKGCYRCLFPEPPPPGAVPTCADAGIIGALAGHLGTLQAMEAVKILLGIGRPLVNRLLIYDGLDGHYHTLKWRRNPSCPLCGDAPTIKELIDYEEFCGVPPVHAADDQAARGAVDLPVYGDHDAHHYDRPNDGGPPPVRPGSGGTPGSAGTTGSVGTTGSAGTQGTPPPSEPAGRPLTIDGLRHWDGEEVHALQVAQLVASGGVQLIDVREPEEYAALRIPGARLLPLGRLERILEARGRDGHRDVNAEEKESLEMAAGGDEPIVFVCRSGERSLMATLLARSYGIHQAVNLHMGMIGWLNEGLPSEAGED